MRKALFLDRDGVINIEKHYLYKQDDFEFIDGIFELCMYYQNLGYLIIVITNQSGIARGYYSDIDFNRLTSWMNSEFKKHKVNITKIYYCPHHPDISGECDCRKPKPGMILNAAKEYNIDLKSSLLIGDKESDIEAALNAGITTTYLFSQNGKTKKSKATKIIKKFNDILDGNVNFK